MISILIPNRDSFEAIQLCIESIRRFTQCPYKIIVWDDCSVNGIDLKYLRECRDKGWLTLHEGTKHLSHGGVLNKLLNEICDTELAVVMDSDVQVFRHGWLEDMAQAVSSGEDIIAVSGIMKKYHTPHCYRTPIYNCWFGIIDMRLYKDGMQTDWTNKHVDRRDEPYKTIFAPYYPPTEAGIDWNRFNENQVAIDPGGKFWVKVNYDNPKGYRVLPLPPILYSKHRHFCHVTFIAFPQFDNNPKVVAERKAKFAQIKAELQRLRGK